MWKGRRGRGFGFSSIFCGLSPRSLTRKPTYNSTCNPTYNPLYCPIPPTSQGEGRPLAKGKERKEAKRFGKVVKVDKRL